MQCSSPKHCPWAGNVPGGHRWVELLYPFPCGIEIHVWPVLVLLVRKALDTIAFALRRWLNLRALVPLIERRDPNPTSVRGNCRFPLVVVVAVACASLRSLNVPRADASVDIARSNRRSKQKPMCCGERVSRFPIVWCGAPRNRACKIRI